ncbi:dispanin subfamily A member 2b-like [Pristis pectinata]|uniref:dispanin subfamily A member 2b-like n=1 Tax=Pristis pectinata TaxID=685728 RepID=UPI00223CB179|nr:dispanin subfamily A member 2b-like [Pristis pectinata]
MEYRGDQMPMSPRTVQVASGALPVRDHLPWSIFNLLYMNICCLGFTAMVFSVKSRDRKVVGDIEGAQHYGSTARSLNIAATLLSIIVFIIFIGLVATGTISVMRSLK